MMEEILIQTQPTPNPNAWKFILNKPVLAEGKSTYSNPQEAEGNMLASALFQIDGVRQVHFFQNVITVTHQFDADVEQVHKSVAIVIQTRMPVHDAFRKKVDDKKDARKNLPAEVQEIEAILDRTIRPGLQGDGGDLAVIKYEDKKLYVHYEGACGTCPSSTSGTLMAIEGILRDEFNPQIEVIPV